MRFYGECLSCTDQVIYEFYLRGIHFLHTFGLTGAYNTYTDWSLRIIQYRSWYLAKSSVIPMSRQKNPDSRSLPDGWVSRYSPEWVSSLDPKWKLTNIDGLLGMYSFCISGLRMYLQVSYSAVSCPCPVRSQISMFNETVINQLFDKSSSISISDHDYRF